MIIYINDKSLCHLIHRNLKGTIVLSEFQEISKLCSLYGIAHIFAQQIDCINIVDCIYATDRNENLEQLNISIQYPDKKWCGRCHTLCDNFSTKYCTERCSEFNQQTTEDKTYVLENIFSSSKKKFDTDGAIENRSNKKDKVSIEKNSNEKFQTSMIKEAVRLEYALKRESYKKEIRQPSLRKTTLSNKKTSDTKTQYNICKSVTKKGVKCTNKALENSDYCGILSHIKISE